MESGAYVRGDPAILEAGFAVLDQAVLVVDEQGTVVACNPAAAELAARPVDEILGKSAEDFEVEARYKDGTPVTPETSRLLRCMRTGKPERDVLVELRPRGGGKSAWVLASYQPLVHEGETMAWGAVVSIVPVASGDEPHDALREASRRLQSLLESGELHLYLKDLEGRYTFANRRLGRELGLPRDDLVGKTDGELLGADLAAARIESDRRALDSRSAIVVDERMTDAASVARTIKFPLLDDDGEPYGLAGVAVDVNPAEAALRDLAAQLELAPCALLAVDRDGRVAFGNSDARALAARSDDLQLAIDGHEPLAELLDDEEVAVEPAIRAGRRLSLTRAFEQPDGSDLWLAVDISPLGEGASAMCALRDVTEIREREEELSHQALHDSLTGLPNRRFTEEQLTLALARARRNGGGVGVVFIDIDNFKGVNDDLGHAVGDEVLVEFAERLAHAVRETDAIGRVADSAPLVARRGGDEFVLVLGDLPASCADLIAKVIERVEAALAKPFRVSTGKLEISASFGAAAHPYDSHDQGALVELANAAMRAAKRRRRGVRFSEPPDAS